jgi:oligogalacturonide lyase
VKSKVLSFLFLFLCLAGAPQGLLSVAADPAPRRWVDPATRHVVRRLSEEPGTASLYFHNNAYTPDGKRIVLVTPRGLCTLNLQTFVMDLVVPGFELPMSRSSGIEVSRKRPIVYYNTRVKGQNTILATELDTHQTRTVAVLPFDGDFGGLSADETLLVGNHVITDAAGGAPSLPAVPAPRMKQFFTVNIQSGEIKTFFRSPDDLNHVQSSPTDPGLFLYAHEGPWHKVDRIWTMRYDGTGRRLMHARSMPYEIAGHEFFSRDGRWIYYDLQAPRSERFFLAGINLATSERVRYPLERGQWSVHYNVSSSGKLFAGDGGGPDSVANKTPLPEGRRLSPPQNGQSIFLYRPVPGQSQRVSVNGEDLTIGRLAVERLADLSRHDYSGGGRGVEPNVTFTPDDRWVVFRSNMEGALHVYAVAVDPVSAQESAAISAEWEAYRARAPEKGR